MQYIFRICAALRLKRVRQISVPLVTLKESEVSEWEGRQHVKVHSYWGCHRVFAFLQHAPKMQKDVGLQIGGLSWNSIENMTQASAHAQTSNPQKDDPLTANYYEKNCLRILLRNSEGILRSQSSRELITFSRTYA